MEAQSVLGRHRKPFARCLGLAAGFIVLFSLWSAGPAHAETPPPTEAAPIGGSLQPAETPSEPVKDAVHDLERSVDRAVSHNSVSACFR